MRLFSLFLVLSVSAMLAGCGTQLSRYNGPEEFKPYVTSEMDAIPMVYGDDPWVYPPNTPPAKVVAGWERTHLIIRVQNLEWRRSFMQSSRGNVLQVEVGENFYTLSPASQRGLANAVAKMYGVGTKTRRGYLLVDYTTRREIGTYTQYGLQLY